MKTFSITIGRIPFLVFVFLLWCCSYSTPSYVNVFWQQQYQEFQRQIKENQVLKKSMAKSDVLDSNALILSSDKSPSDVLYRRTISLLHNLKRHDNSHKFAEFEKILNTLRPPYFSMGLSKSTASYETNDKELFMQLSALNKEVALSNPLIDFDSLLFVGYTMPKAGTEAHICDQYNAWNIGMGGGLFILKGIKSGNVTLINVLQNSKCLNGTFKGQNLSGGAFLSPDLSYDGKTILFAWSPSTNPCYHIFKVDVNGSNLTQLTDGSSSPNNFLTNANHNDFDPVWLPNGRVAFISDRRGGYGRCHTKSKPTFTLHSMKDDGSDIICLSYHETNEWQPSVDNRGKIVYTRWDYVDRDDCIAHHMWECYPDGRDPRSYHGNYPLPLNTLTGSNFGDGRFYRPFAEFNIRAIPNSQKYVAIAGVHHNFTFGELIMIDPTIEDDGKVSQVKRITTVWTNWPDFTLGPYGTPWPLSEDYYFLNKNNSLVLRDRFGDEQVIYTNTAWRPIDPIPLKPRTKPLALSTQTWQGERKTLNDRYRATIKINNIRNADMALPANTNVKALRIVEVFPKETINLNDPRNGYPSESLCRMSLGTASVEADGSVYCEAPVGKTIYFQLLDDRGLAVASMRSATYVHAGEQLICAGCHENKWIATPPDDNRIAFKRLPSKLIPDAGGVEPVNFARLVKPVFDKNCTSCHTQQSKGPNMSYGSLKDYAFYFCSEASPSFPPYLNGDIVSPIRGGSRSVPGKLGASFSKLINYINGTHHNAKLTDDEYKRVTLWLDLNSNELGADYNVTQQRSGQLVWPRNDIDITNPQGIEKDVPLKDSLIVHVSNYNKNLIHVNRSGSLVSFSNSSIQIAGASLYDLSGRCIYKRNFNKAVNAFSLDLIKSPLANGTYIIKFISANKNEIIYSAKLMIN